MFYQAWEKVPISLNIGEFALDIVHFRRFGDCVSYDNRQWNLSEIYYNSKKGNVIQFVLKLYASITVEWW